MKIFVFLCAASLAFAFPHSEWQIFKAKHNKMYKNHQEEQFRMSVFVENKKKIEEHNEKFENGQVSFKMAMNQFGDLLSHEVKTIMNGFKKGEKKLKNERLFISNKTKTAENFDWREMGAVTPVKNQGQCGSCWSFSTTGALEGQIFMKTGSLVSLSEQNLMDCSTGYGNYGCGGGNMDPAFAYIQDNHGIDTEESYPYEEKNGKCRFNAANVGGTDKGFIDIPSGDEEALKQAVATIGPIAVAIDAGHESFHFYTSGVYIEPICSTEELDHAVLAVGFGTENGHDYWLVKNSWGATWGESGYIKMARNKNNHCGIASEASYPIV